MPLMHKAHFRHARYYESVLRELNQHYLRGGAMLQAALERFESEWPKDRLSYRSVKDRSQAQGARWRQRG